MPLDNVLSVCLFSAATMVQLVHLAGIPATVTYDGHSPASSLSSRFVAQNWLTTYRNLCSVCFLWPTIANFAKGNTSTQSRHTTKHESHPQTSKY